MTAAKERSQLADISWLWSFLGLSPLLGVVNNVAQVLDARSRKSTWECSASNLLDLASPTPCPVCAGVLQL